MNRIVQMLQLQQQLNDATNGEGWEKGITKNGKLIDWKRCAYLECAELIESYPWKHWKNIDAKPDYENIKIETVDIWHFVMSEALREYKINHRGTMDALARTIHALPNFSTFEGPLHTSDKNCYEQIEVVEKFLKTLFCGSSFHESIEAFIEIAIQSGLNLDALYKLYIGKNILNQFRQDHGYKEGSYQKLWNGIEDNIVMQQLLDREEIMTANELYSALEAAYPTK